jgi:(heptosyl)LPS beta-1,4-glucosyltransferase
MKPGLSVVIVAHNQRDLLKTCLKSIKNLSDEIILIDLASTEDLKSVGSTFKVKYIKHKLVSVVEEVRQESLAYATHEYVLFLDPDETIPPALAADLKVKIKAAQFDYFTTPRQNYVFGKWLKHSRWWPDLQTRIFRVGHATWGKTLHAEVELTGIGYTYPEDEGFAIRHENYRNLDEYLSKNMRYAKTDAAERIAANQPLTFISAMRLSVSELISRFFLGNGYKDGMHGLILAILQSFYYFMVYAYYWEQVGYQDLENENTIKSFPRAWFAHALSETMYWDKAKNSLKVIKEKFVRRMIG